MSKKLKVTYSEAVIPLSALITIVTICIMTYSQDPFITYAFIFAGVTSAFVVLYIAMRNKS